MQLIDVIGILAMQYRRALTTTVRIWSQCGDRECFSHLNLLLIDTDWYNLYIWLCKIELSDLIGFILYLSETILQ